MLIDSGSTHDFISEDFIRRHSLATTSGPDDIRITLADGSTTSRQIVTTGDVTVLVKDFSETQHFTVFPLFRYDAILDKPWLFRNNLNINFQTNEVVLGQEHISARFDEPNGAASDYWPRMGMDDKRFVHSVMSVNAPRGDSPAQVFSSHFPSPSNFGQKSRSISLWVYLRLPTDTMPSIHLWIG